MQTKFLSFLVFFCFVSSFTKTFSQKKLISVVFEEKQLNNALNDISEEYEVRFAFDIDYFSSIKISETFVNATVDEVLKNISANYNIDYKHVGGIYILYKANKKITPQKKVKPPSIKRKHQQIFRLYTGAVFDAETGKPIQNCSIEVNKKDSVVTNKNGCYIFSSYNTSNSIRIIHPKYKPLTKSVASRTNMPLHLFLVPIIQREYLVELEKSPNTDYIYPTRNPESDQNISTFYGEYNLQANTMDIAINANVNPSILTNSILFNGINHEGLFNENISSRNSFDIYNNIGTIGSNKSNLKFNKFNYDTSDHVLPKSEAYSCNKITKEPEHCNNEATFLLTPIHLKMGAGYNFNEDIYATIEYQKSFIGTLNSNLGNNLLYPTIITTNQGNAISNKMLQPSFNYSNLNASIKYKLNTTERFEVFTQQNNLNRNFTYYTSIDNTIIGSDHINTIFGLGVKWFKEIRSNWTSVVTAGGLKTNNGLKRTFSYNNQTEIENEKNEISDLFLKWNSELTNNHLIHRFGANIRSIQTNYSFQQLNIVPITTNLKTDTVNIDRSTTNFNLFYNVKIDNWEKLSIDAGLRNSFNIDKRKSLFQPSINANYLLSDQIKVKLETGKYINQVISTFRFDNTLNPINIILIPQQGHESIIYNKIGLDFINNRFSAKFEASQDNIKGDEVAFIHTISNTNLKHQWHSVRKVVRGLSFNTSYETYFFEHHFVYAYKSSTSVFSGLNGNDPIQSSFIPKHRFKATEVAKYGSWMLVLTCNVASGVGYYNKPAVGLDQVSIDRLPSFTRFDASLSRRIKYKQFELDAGLSLVNLFNNQNQIAISRFPYNSYLNNIDLESIEMSLPFSAMLYLQFHYH